VLSAAGVLNVHQELDLKSHVEALADVVAQRRDIAAPLPRDLSPSH